MITFLTVLAYLASSWTVLSPCGKGSSHNYHSISVCVGAVQPVWQHRCLPGFRSLTVGAPDALEQLMELWFLLI